MLPRSGKALPALVVETRRVRVWRLQALSTEPSAHNVSKRRPRSRRLLGVLVPFVGAATLIAVITPAPPGPPHRRRLADDDWLLVRSGVLLGSTLNWDRDVLPLSKRVPSVPGNDAAEVNEDEHQDVLDAILQNLDEWRRRWVDGGSFGIQALVMDRLADVVAHAETEHGEGKDRKTLQALVRHGALTVFIQYLASAKPTDRPHVLRLLHAMESLLVTAQESFDELGLELRIPLASLGAAIGHLVDQDAVLFTDLLRLGDALFDCHLKGLELEDERRAHTFSLREIRGVEDAQSRADVTRLALLRGGSIGFGGLCSPEMPRSIKFFGLWALTEMLREVDRTGSSISMTNQSRQLEEVLSPHFAAMLLTLPRRDVAMQVQTAQLLEVMLRVAQKNVALVPRETYEAWMKLVRQWTATTTKTTPPTTTTKSVIPLTWRRSRQPGSDDDKPRSGPATPNLPLQLLASRCLRTLSSHSHTCRFLRESPATRVALFEMTRSIHEGMAADRENGKVTASLKSSGESISESDWINLRESVDPADENEIYNGIQTNLSRTFRNICRGFKSGHVALESLFASTWTASLLQSRRSLPMSRFFRDINDLTELPVIGADDYESSTEFGWVDILTAWIANPSRQIRENAIDTLTFLAEQRDATSPTTGYDSDDEIGEKQSHILQAWLTSMLQHVRLESGGEILAVRQMEQIAQVSEEFTPGNEKVLFNPAVVDAGTSAVAVLAENHHEELVQQGVVPLMALLGASPSASTAQKSQCARVLANLVAACCLDLGASNPFAAREAQATPHALVNELWQAAEGRAIWRHFVAEHLDVEQVLMQTYSGRSVLREFHNWPHRKDPMQRSQFYRVLNNLSAYRELVETGSLTSDIYNEGVHPIVARSDEPNGDKESTNAPAMDIVFVHGLRGHPFGTWRTDMGSSVGGTNDIWPDVLLRKDLEARGVRARLITLGYEAGMVSWSSPWPSLSLQERARVMLDALYAANVGRDGRPVVFVTHSMGGLLVKKMLLLASDQQVVHEVSGDVPSLATSTDAVVFLAVPHFGSELANGARHEAIRKLVQTHPAIQDLCADHDGRLDELNDKFKALGVDCLSMAEAKPAPLGLGLTAMVVKPRSANPGVGRFRILPGSDHMTICKAKSRDSPMYREVFHYLLARFTASTKDSSPPTV